MKDPGTDIYTALYTLLNGNVKNTQTGARRYYTKALEAGYTGGDLTCILESNTALAGEETSLGVYNFMPDSVSGGYVYLGELNYSDDSAKDRFWLLGNLDLQIVLPAKGPKGSKANLNAYTDTVLNLIKPQVGSVLDLTPNFTNTYLYTGNVRELTTLFDDGRTIRRVIQLTLGIEQNI